MLSAEVKLLLLILLLFWSNLSVYNLVIRQHISFFTGSEMRKFQSAVYFQECCHYCSIFYSYSSLERITVTLNFSSQITFFGRMTCTIIFFTQVSTLSSSKLSLGWC